MYLKVKSFANGKPILYGLNSMQAQYGVTMSDTDVQPDAQGKKYISEGMFVVQVGDKARFLPRTKLHAATATDSNTVVLKAPNNQFLVGDVLYAQAGFAEVVIDGTVEANSVVTIRIDNTSYSVDVTNGASAADVAQSLVTELSSSLSTDKGVVISQKGTSGTVTLFSRDAYKIDVYTTSAALRVSVSTTDPGYFGDYLVPLGTIASISVPASDGTREVSLVSNAAYVVPENCPVGVNVDKFIGIYPEPLDYTDEPKVHLAPIVAADGVYENNLPYIDQQLKREFSQLNINKFFYKNA